MDKLSMFYMRSFVFLLVLSISLDACTGAEEPDTEKPAIDLTDSQSFPTSCDTIYFGESFQIKAVLTDNAELGSFNIDIHHNFDQHSHSTELEQCDFDDKKVAVNPFIFIQDYTIPESSTSYTISQSMTLPSDDGTTRYDEGDYHFQISVTDKEGWSKFVGLNIKILHR